MNAPVTSWQGVADEVRRRLRERTWRPGDLIPGEVELAREFGCARATVNRALRQLAEDGLLERRRRAGTRVAHDPVRKAILEIAITRLEVEGRGRTYRHALLEREEAPPPALVAGRLGVDASVPMLHLRALHLADDQPFLYEDRWINIAAVPGVTEEGFSSISANEWLVRNAPYTKGDISLSAANATDLEAELLAARPGDALFIVDRTTWNDDEPVTTVRLAYAPGHRMRSAV